MLHLDVVLARENNLYIGLVFVAMQHNGFIKALV